MKTNFVSKMSVCGRSSSCSINQDEGIQREMQKTPKTPIKTAYPTTPKRSERKRSLFQSNSPTKSDDLGMMSPLSSSSSSSIQSLNSPHFSPNGKLSTLEKIPKNGPSSTSRVSSKKIEVKSSLFPDLKMFSPKNRRAPRTPKTTVSKIITPEKKIEVSRNYQTTPSRKFRKRELFVENVVADSDSSLCDCNLSQESIENTLNNEIPDCPTILGIKPLSCENFYGSVTKVNKPQTKLFIDTLERNHSGFRRSLSKESLASNKSFVKGGTRKKVVNSKGLQQIRRLNSTNNSRLKSGGRNKGLQPGVWHNIKRPKQIKKIQKIEKPLISPKDRLEALNIAANDKTIKIKAKSFLQENSRKKAAYSKKRYRIDKDDDDDKHDIFDHFVKRKKLPLSQAKLHPAVISPETLTPDPNKKFLKYGRTTKATFTLNENVKLNISDGVIKLQTPKKRRKLYSGKKNWNEDFNEFEETDNGIQKSIEGILNILEDDRPLKKVESVISNNLTKVISPKNDVRSPLKTVSNLPTLIINDFDSEDEETYHRSVIPESEKKSCEITLEKTGNMVSYTTNILVNEDLNFSPGQEFGDDAENLPPNKDKFYSLFYKQNWKKWSENDEEENSKKPSSKKNAFIPDDQYLLDAGQESVGIVTCKKCGIMYQAGDYADEATHNNFHNHLPELKFTGWSNERVVGRYPDGRVIMVLGADPKIWWQKVSKIVEIVDQELGFPEASVQSLFYKTVYLYINDKSKQIVGCLIAEECKVAYKMFPPLEGVEIDSCSKDPSPCRVGISRIWAALPHRRKGVASRMLECLQKTFFFGDIVSLDQIAFSVPSPSGAGFVQDVHPKERIEKFMRCVSL